MVGNDPIDVWNARANDDWKKQFHAISCMGLQDVTKTNNFLVYKNWICFFSSPPFRFALFSGLCAKRFALTRGLCAAKRTSHTENRCHCFPFFRLILAWDDVSWTNSSFSLISRGGRQKALFRKGQLESRGWKFWGFLISFFWGFSLAKNKLATQKFCLPKFRVA